ncbi:MAG: hypothetical protein J0G98_00050 [Terrimonas ferruginea]|uniref:hypothetical protein n=1 Tax=Terrimonas ferruginea TaxID=249 RepID=UPI001AC15153|nr:hypothetical protein [Terrimonas ferruginea]MBN8781424.1 hypothetical protein [Terrimonas ferruginea]
MKAIVVRQPWATLIALGVKTIETRPSPPNGDMRPEGVRGLPGCSLERGERIAIVAGAANAPEGWRASPGERGSMAHGDLGGEWVVCNAELLELCDERREDLPLGAVVCTVTVADAVPITGQDHELDWGNPCLWVDHEDGTLGLWEDVPPSLPDMDPERLTDLTAELPLGFYEPGRWGWLLSDPRPCTPIPCKGKQGVFDLPAEIADHWNEDT